MSSIIGGGSKSSSNNKAYDYLMQTLSPGISQGAAGGQGALANILGVGADPHAQDAAFQNYLGSTGYQFMMDQGSKAITNNAAAKGLLQSGSTLKALSNYGQGMGSQYFQNYLGNLSDLSKLGLQSASIVGSAGQSSKGSSTGGIFSPISLI